MGTDASIARRTFVGGVMCTLGLRGALANPAPSFNERMQGEFEPVHDPCIIRQDDTYYVFSTNTRSDTAGFIACRRSRDLVSWERAGYVFTQIPEWAHDAVPSAKGLWAPDISHVNGEYRLYYSASSFGSNNSVIGLATNRTLDATAAGYEWVDKGLVMRSRAHDKFNAIDPNLVVDREGKHWLSWGSFWSGLKMFRVDPATGKRMEGEEMYSLASRAVGRGAPNAIEAPFIISRGDFYYLFASFDFCCRGAKSDYFVACAARAMSRALTST
jgi:arabinan endo-1,5-alpha-L-arabinosidase